MKKRIPINNEPASKDSPVHHVRRDGAGLDLGLQDAGVFAGYQEILTVSPPDNSYMEFSSDTGSFRDSGVIVVGEEL